MVLEPCCREVIAGVQAELRASRAPREAGVVTRDDREAAVNALREDGPSVRAWLPKGKHKAGLVFNTDLDRVAEAIAFARGASQAAPPADEVAGLLEDLRAIGALALSRAGKTGAIRSTALERIGRLEQHLKGKR